MTTGKKKYLGSLGLAVVLVAGWMIADKARSNDPILSQAPKNTEKSLNEKEKKADAVELSQTVSRNWETYYNDKYGFYFDYPEILRGYTTESPFFSLSRDRGKSIYVTAVNYDDLNSAEQYGYAISKKLKNSIALTSQCQFPSPETYIRDQMPGEFINKQLCKVKKIDDRFILYGITAEYRSGGLPILGDIIIVFNPKQAIVFTDLVLDDESQEVKDIVRKFRAVNPDANFPSVKFGELYRLVDAQLQEELNKPSADVSEAMYFLEQVVNSFRILQ